MTAAAETTGLNGRIVRVGAGREATIVRAKDAAGSEALEIGGANSAAEVDRAPANGVGRVRLRSISIS